MHDLIIRGGTIADGSGQPTRTGDVAIDGSIVTAVGEVDGPARRVIDADGLLVTPGWVDIHTHYDGQATWDPEVSPSGWHGVTTVVMGNCGVGFAPARGLRPRLAHPADGGRGGHPGHGAGRGHELELGDLRRVSRRGGAHRPRARRGVARPARRPARLRARRGPGQRHGQRRGDRRNGGAGARGRPGRRHRRLDHPHDPAPGQGRRAGGGHHRGGRRAHRHRRGPGQGGAPGLLRGQRHAGPRPRVRLDVGDLHPGRRAGHLPGAAGRLRARPVARVDRPRRGRQPPRGLARPAGGRQADLAHGRLPVRHPPLRPPPGVPGDRAPATGRAGGPPAHARGARRHPGRGATPGRLRPAAARATCTSCSRWATRPTTSRRPSAASRPSPRRRAGRPTRSSTT